MLTGLLTGRLDRLGENVRGGGLGASDDMGVDAEGDGRVGVAEASSDDVDPAILLKIGWSLADGHPFADVVARPPACRLPLRCWPTASTVQRHKEGVMTGPEHYRRTEQPVESVTRRGKGELEDKIVVSNDHPGVIAAAQVHAVLASVAATALDSDRREWFNVAGSKLSD